MMPSICSKAAARTSLASRTDPVLAILSLLPWKSALPPPPSPVLYPRWESALPLDPSPVWGGKSGCFWRGSRVVGRRRLLSEYRDWRKVLFLRSLRCRLSVSPLSHCWMRVLTTLLGFSHSRPPPAKGQRSWVKRSTNQ